jgi:putative hemolysin
MGAAAPTCQRTRGVRVASRPFANPAYSASAHGVTPFPWTDVLIIAGLILLNGLFAMSELAIVSARPALLKVAADKGSRNARCAMALAADPGKFLSTVQIGITLIGILAGAYSGASLGGPVAERLAALGIPARAAGELGFALVIVLTTYFSVVVGELVPKQVALRIAEPVAQLAARPMTWLSTAMAPFVWLLDRSSALLLRLIGMRPSSGHAVTAEELHMIFAEAIKSGVIEEEQQEIMTGIMRLAHRPVRELMTPRIEIDWVDVNAGEDEIFARIQETPHSLMPVADGVPDNIVGVLKVRDFLALRLAGQPAGIAALMRKAEVIPDQLDAMDALRLLQQSGVSMAMVHDEYGHLEGVVTLADLLAAIAGDFVSHQDEGDQPLLAERDDGSLLIAGALPAEALAKRLALELDDDREFATAAGYVLWMLKHLPKEGETFTDQGWRFEVVDMDGLKIDKLLVSRLADDAESLTEREGDPTA